MKIDTSVTQEFAYEVMQLVFDIERQGDWMSDMMSSIEANGGVVEPKVLAEELSLNVGSYSSLANDIESVMGNFRILS